MSYKYEEQKPWIFSEEGQVAFLRIRDNVQELLKKAGAVSMGRAGLGTTVDGWQKMACVDRLVELGEIKEIPRSHDRLNRYRVFVKCGE